MKQEAFHPVLSPSFVAHALGLSLPGVLSTQAFTSVTTDSRKIEAGCLFVALKGEKFDGHEFISAAVQGGARGIICRRDAAAAISSSVKVFAVDDTLLAYRRLASAWRREFPIPTVAVAGSVGKT